MTHRFEHLRLKLLGDDDVDLTELRREFPTISLESAAAIGPSDIVVDDRAWYGAFDLRSLDEKIETAGHCVSVGVRGYDVAALACEIITRYQRYLDRRNDASSDASFDAILASHATFYDGTPLELDHAFDTWQWVLRLDPRASRAVQLAALFHDVERLEAADRQRLEHRVPDGQGTASTGSERLTELLVRAGVLETDARRVREIVHAPERRVDAEVALLDDADALSFMSLCSAQYCDYFGVAQTRRKVAYMLSRLGPCARERLERVRLRPDVERLLREVAA